MLGDNLQARQPGSRGDQVGEKGGAPPRVPRPRINTDGPARAGTESQSAADMNKVPRKRGKIVVTWCSGVASAVGR